MSWLDLETSFYKCQTDNIGQPATFRNILLTQFAVPHNWFYKNENNKWVNGFDNDLQTIVELRNLDKTSDLYKSKKLELKGRLLCFTPAGLLETKKKGMVKEIRRTGIMQLDFDYNDIASYDVEELKKCVFSLPFIGFCGLSCSGDGFFALAFIEEPEKLSEYAEHCFEVLKAYGIKADESKGKKVENLRYMSYDSRMLIRENPAPLKVNCFKRKEVPKIQPAKLGNTITPNLNNLVTSELNKLRAAQTGNRWQTVQQVAYTLGGLNDCSLIDLIKNEICVNREFAGQEDKYMNCGEYCFEQGRLKPININV